MKTEKVNVTPAMAAKWLGHNAGNRKLREHRVKFFAEAMNTGKWKLTHQGVAIATTGRLIDGQHRLRAVILSGKTVPMMVTTDAAEDSYAVLDAGMARSMAERLGADNVYTRIATSMWRFAGPSKTPHEYEVELMLEVFGPAMEAYENLRVRGSGKPPGAAAAAACVLALATSKGTRRAAEVRELVERVVNTDLVGAPAGIASYFKHMTVGVRAGRAMKRKDVEPQKDIFCRTWQVVDPKFRDTTKLTIRDYGVVTAQAKAAFNSVTDNVFG
jgi:hypothetical protein